MRTFNKHRLAVAYEILRDAVETGGRILQKDLGLSPVTASLFLKVVTQPFPKEKFHFQVNGHEYSLNQLFIKKSDGIYIKNPELGKCTVNPAIIDLISQALAIASKARRIKKDEIKKSRKKVEPKPTRKDLLQKLAILYEEQGKIANEISVVLKTLTEYEGLN